MNIFKSLFHCCMSNVKERELLSADEEIKIKEVKGSYNSQPSKESVKSNPKKLNSHKKQDKNSSISIGEKRAEHSLQRPQIEKKAPTAEKKSSKLKEFVIIEPPPEQKSDMQIIEESSKPPGQNSLFDNHAIEEQKYSEPERKPPEKKELQATISPSIEIRSSKEEKSEVTPLVFEIDDSMISASPKLKLEVIEGPVLKPGIVIDINAAGMLGSKRQAGDGYTYFGTDPESGNDFIVPLEEKGFGKKHFVIKFDPLRRIYSIKDLEDGTGTFIKISPKWNLSTNCIISFGEIHFATIIPPPTAKSQINIKFLEGIKARQSFTFTSEQSPITVGRKDGCSIHFPTGSLSRIQCKVVFEDEKWVVYDGDGTKGSTNGTWLFADVFYELKDDLVFKAAQTLFHVSIQH